MKIIGLIKGGNSYLPEILAYKQYFNQRGYKVRVLQKANELTDEDIEWHFLGIDASIKRKGRIKIHEYASLSIPPYSRIKNKIKKFICTKPDLRIFNNSFVKSEMNFKDGVKSTIRKAGIDKRFFCEPQLNAKTYDYVYLGAMDKSRKIEKILSKFIKNFPNNNLLIIGSIPASFPSFVVNHPNISWTGKIPYEDVPIHLKKAHTGINFIPPIYPYCNQASLKLIEYCAMGLNIATTSYSWVNEFENRRNARFFRILPDFSNFHPHNLATFNYVTPQVDDLSWSTIISQSGILEHIQR